MKKIAFISMWLVMLPWVVKAQTVEDDLYFVPKKNKKKEVVQKQKTEQKSTISLQELKEQQNVSNIVVRDRNGNARDVDEYNRRYSAKQNTFSVVNDTLYIDEREDSDLEGEWINGFDGSEMDYEYATRIIRFRNPRYAIPVSSPLYWDIVYAQNYTPWDWNVYTDGFYAYMFPTFSNSLWWDWNYSPWRWGWNSWHYSSYYRWGWGGWYDPWYSHNHWYAHHWHHHGPHYGWGGGHWNKPVYRPSYSDRPSVAQRGHDRGNRYDSGTRFSGTKVNGSNDNRYSGTRVNGSSTTERYNGVQSYRSTANGGNRNNATSVRPSNTTRGDRYGNSQSATPRRSTSTYVRPNSSRSNSNSYSRPSSTRSSSQSDYNNRSNSSNRSESNYRSGNSGSSIRSSGYGGGGGSRSSGTSGSSRSGGGRSRR